MLRVPAQAAVTPLLSAKASVVAPSPRLMVAAAVGSRVPTVSLTPAAAFRVPAPITTLEVLARQSSTPSSSVPPLTAVVPV